MTLGQAKEEFVVRFYRWAAGDFEREVRQGLPFVASIKSGPTLRFLEIWKLLSQEERVRVQSAFLKWAHPEAVEITGEYQTPEEKEIFERYRVSCREDSVLEREIWRRRFAGQGPVKKINRRRFAARTKQELQAILGDHLRLMTTTDLHYETTIGPWTVKTWVTIGQPPSYFHFIVAQDHVYLQERHIDLLSWLGIPGGQGGLFWDCILDDDDAEGAAISIGMLCGHFLRAVPSLLEGLSHDVPPHIEPPVEEPKIRLVKKRG